MKDLVSVVVPVFNRRLEIARALDSVLKQSYEYWEVIVVDDGSTDDTTEVVENYARSDARIHVIKLGQRKGAQAARNAGIRAAQGAWIAFLDSDDQWLPASLEVRLQKAREKKVHVVHSDCYILRPENGEPEHFGVPPMEGWVYQELLLRPGPVFPGLLVSKEALRCIGALNEGIVSHQEWDIGIRLGKHYEFGFVAQPTFIYDCRQADAISRGPFQSARGYEQVFTHHQRSILRYLGPKALASHYEKAASLYLKANRKAQAFRCFVRSALLWPFRPITFFTDRWQILRLGL